MESENEAKINPEIKGQEKSNSSMNLHSTSMKTLLETMNSSSGSKVTSLSDFLNSNNNSSKSSSNRSSNNSSNNNTSNSTKKVIKKLDLDLLKGEVVIEQIKAYYLNPDIEDLLGYLNITNYSLIFSFLNKKKSLSYFTNFSSEFFKIPLILISSISKAKNANIELYKPYPIEISVKDNRVVTFYIIDSLNDNKFFMFLYERVFPKDFSDFYSFTKIYKSEKFSKLKSSHFTEGWDIYNIKEEFIRQGVNNCSEFLRFSDVNNNYHLCETYPKLIVEPYEISDTELLDASNYRTKNRLPIFTYLYNCSYSKFSPSIWRCAQNKGWVINRRNNSDEKLLNSLIKMGKKLYIYDCRPKLNAFVNKIAGGGYENIDNYALEYDNNKIELIFCEIDNIHKVRQSYQNLCLLCMDKNINSVDSKFYSKLESSGWFNFLYLLLKYSNEISKKLQGNNTVLIHCSDGWDRTAQLSSLSQLLVEPYYRTIKGFIILIEKDWLSFGHQFALRNGLKNKNNNKPLNNNTFYEDQFSPIFLQFLDCVYQLINQFPNCFEFNEDFLLFLAKNFNNNLYGTFMYNNDRERNQNNYKETCSIWTDVYFNIEKYKSDFYNKESMKILEPNFGLYNLKLWKSFYMSNNLFLLKSNFFLYDNDYSMEFNCKEEFYSYIKKDDTMHKEIIAMKYNYLIEVLGKVYDKIKDQKSAWESLDEETRNSLAHYSKMKTTGDKKG